MPEIIAGIDPSTSTGICILQDGVPIYTDLLKLKKPGDTNGKAFALFADTIWAVFVRFGVQAFAVEQKIHGGNIKSNANVLDMASFYQTRSEEIAQRLNIPVTLIPIQTWRATFLPGKRPPKPPEPPAHILKSRAAEWQSKWKKDWWKSAAIAECERRGIKVKGHDSAEAVGIALTLWAQRHPLGWQAANSLFDLPEGKPERATLSLPQAKTEAARVFSNFAETAD